MTPSDSYDNIYKLSRETDSRTLITEQWNNLERFKEFPSREKRRTEFKNKSIQARMQPKNSKPEETFQSRGHGKPWVKRKKGTGRKELIMRV